MRLDKNSVKISESRQKWLKHNGNLGEPIKFYENPRYPNLIKEHQRKSMKIQKVHGRRKKNGCESKMSYIVKQKPRTSRSTRSLLMCIGSPFMYRLTTPLVHFLLGYFGLFLFRHVTSSLIDSLANRALWFLPTQTRGLIPDRQSLAQKKPGAH